MTGVFVFSSLPNVGLVRAEGNDVNVDNPQRTALTAEASIDECTVTWSSVYFGEYPQSDAAGNTKEPIKWQVLSVDEDNVALLLAEQNLDIYPYNVEIANVKWEDCSLRQWLNNEFMNKAFSEEAQEALVDNEEDKVTLLSDSQALNLNYGFYPSTYPDALRIKKNTAYAAAGGSAGYNEVSAKGEANSWWLKTGGYYKDDAVFISDTGSVRVDGITVAYGGNAVCPAVYVDLNKAIQSGVITAADNISEKEEISHSLGYTVVDNKWEWNYDGDCYWDYKWRFNIDGSVSIVPKFFNFSHEPVIPQKISDHGNEYQVNNIEGCEYGESYDENGNLQEWSSSEPVYIYIPASIKSIDDKAFQGKESFIIICGEKGSYAEEYAKEKGIVFADGTSIKDAKQNMIINSIDTGDKVLNICVWNDEFPRRLEEYYPGYIANDEEDASKGGTIWW